MYCLYPFSPFEREREREREKDRDSFMIVVGMYLNTSNLGLVWFGLVFRMGNKDFFFFG